ncbi:MAG: tetratricopeptide repeat protein [Planctomycetes bacterium]|nr:tetratricopeptide repeat protein [Planctomycetota bacterium]
MLLSSWTRTVPAVALALALWSASARADEADDQYAVASGHYAQKRWQFAVEEFQTFLQEHPAHASATQAAFFLAEALVQLGRHDEAAVHFRNYLDRDPKGRFAAPATFRVGETAHLAGRFDVAGKELERFLATFPDHKLNAHVLPLLGEMALARREAGNAETYFRRGLSQFPQGETQDRCRFGLARALEKQKKIEEAERLFLAVAAKPASPLTDDAQFSLAALLYASGRLEEALEAFAVFESELTESPRRSTARLGYGWALVKLGRLAEAQSVFQSVVSDAQVAADARYWLGLTQKSRKDWQAAAKTLLEAAEDFPDHQLAAALRFHAGDALVWAGDLAAAQKQFERVIETGSSQWIDEAMRGKVQVALRLKDHATIDRQAAQFVARFPESPLGPDVRRMLAQSLVQRKEHQRAIELLEPVVKGAGQQEQVDEERYLLSLSYAGLERHQDALDVLSPVVESSAGKVRGDAQLARASLLMKLERFDEAIAPLEKILAAGPNGDEAVGSLGNLAICHARTGQLEKAKQRYAELVQKYPNHELIAPTTEQLAEASYDAGDVAWAGTLFTALAADGQSSGHSLQGLSGLGWTQYRAGQLEKAAETFDQLLGKKPEPSLAAETALIRGQILKQLGRLDAALVMYDLVVDRHPKSEQFSQALWQAALLRDKRDENEQAAALYERLVTDCPQFAEIDAALYNWAWVLDDLNRGEEAKKLFDRVRNEHPKSTYWADATFRLAQRSYEAQDYARSRQLIGDLLAKDLSDQIRENACYLQGQLAAAEGKWDDARRSFETLLGNHPKSPLRLMAEYGIAEASFRQDDYGRAGEQFDLLVRQTKGRSEPWLAVIHLRLAQSLSQEKKWDKAFEIASTIEGRYPNFEEQYEADYVLGRCLSNRAEFELARQTYEKVIRSPGGEKTETAAKAQLMIAESYYHQKNYKMALREYLALEILYDYPTWQAAALLQAAKCHEMLGEWKEAVDLYGKLRSTYPNTTFSEEAEDRSKAAKQRLATEPAP